MTTASPPDLPQPVRSAEGLFSLPTLAYLRASQGERVAIVCYGLGGLLDRVEALSGQLTWFFPKEERPLVELLAGEAIAFDLIVEYRPHQ